MKFDRIYRFMDLNKFRDMVNNHRLCLVHFEKWEDEYEGLLFRMCNDPSIYRILYDKERFDGISHDQRVFIEITLKEFSRFFFGQSWTKCPELWKFGDIRVEVLIDSIEQIEGVIIKEIEYSDDDITKEILVREIVKLFGENDNKVILINAFVCKRKQFDFEEEIRLLIHNQDFLNKPTLSFPPGGLVALYKAGQISYDDCMRTIKEIQEKTIVPYKIYVSFAHIDHFINSVGLSPSVKKGFEQKIQKLCRKNHIPFQSKYSTSIGH